TLFSDGKLEIRNASNVVVGPAIPGDDRIARIDVLDRSTRRYASSNESWQNCLIATSANGVNSYTWKVGMTGATFVTRAVGTTTDPVLSFAPDTLSAGLLGGDPIVVARRSGTLALGNTLYGCDRDDPHPGPGENQAPASFGSGYLVQTLQDFGNRYLLFADGTVQAWGIKQAALGVGTSEDGSLGYDGRETVKAPGASPGAALTGVSMLARGEDLQQTRALVRSAVAADDGTVYYWGDGIPTPKRIERAQLPRVCFIAGPYAVGCGGQLYHVAIGAGPQFAPTVTQVTGVPPVWRVAASAPTARTTVDGNGDPVTPTTCASDCPSDDDVITTSLKLGHVAIAQDGTTWQLDGPTAQQIGN
ncbi:MAG: hypothetical protein AB7G13_26055, partial [Lautropia sp.]